MNDVIAQVIQIQDEHTDILAERVVESAVSFRETKDMFHLIQILILIDRTLSENGVFLREVLDVLEEKKYISYN